MEKLAKVRAVLQGLRDEGKIPTKIILSINDLAAVASDFQTLTSHESLEALQSSLGVAVETEDGATDLRIIYEGGMSLGVI